MRRAQRHISPIAIALLMAATGAALRAAPALASGNQETIFQDDVQLHANPTGTLSTLRGLGVERVRIFMPWSAIAPGPSSRKKPSGFSASDPASYPGKNWIFFDNLVQQANAAGIGLDVTLSGPAPQWATGGGAPRGAPKGVWKPSAAAFAQFVHAVGTRYSGRYRLPGASSPIPRIRYWSIWNEPNYGPDLGPQEIHRSGVEVAPSIYRGLLDSAWSALHATGHGSDTILFGEVAPRGITTGGQPGNFGGMVPLRFLRTLYCVDSSYRPLGGRAAAARGCPSSSRAFRASNPALFAASGFADHPYPQGLNPVKHTWPNRGPDQYTDLPQVPVLERFLDRVNRVYGSRTRFTIYSTEYGYRTNPPTPGQPSFTTSALWINWAEYISWRNSRMASYMQYGLVDPPRGNFPSSLETSRGKPKQTYDAFRMPLFLPVTAARRGRGLEVWGCVRGAHFAVIDAGSAQPAEIQFQRGSRGSFQTLKQVHLSGRGYFDVGVTFPASGSVRIAWVPPSGVPLHSRVQKITVR